MPPWKVVWLALTSGKPAVVLVSPPITTSPVGARATSLTRFSPFAPPNQVDARIVWPLALSLVTNPSLVAFVRTVRNAPAVVG